MAGVREPVDRQVEVDGLYLEARCWAGGDGTPVVLLHEGLGSITAWGRFPALLAEACGRTVIAYSRQGYGRSSGWPGTRPLDYLAQEARRLPQVLDAFGLKRAVLLGHSDGGAIAIEAGALHESRVAALVLEAAHVTVERSTQEAVRSVGERWTSGDLRERLTRHHDDPAGVFRGWHDVWTSEAFWGWSIAELLPEITCPVLAIRGAQDALSSAYQLDVITSGIPQVEAVTLPDCGHVPHKEARERTLALVAAFVRKL
jgi:pimeloyl-ACP methyl ester carboxylesterase